MGLSIKPITDLSYNKFGFFQNLINPEGQSFNGDGFSFYRDLISTPHGGQGGNIGFSVCLVKKRPLIVDVMEYHSNIYEAILPLDGDILLQVIPASQNGKLPVDKMEVFSVPKGTLVVLRSGVWHYAPFAYDCDAVNVLVVIPERAYANDCSVVELDEPVRIMD
jgi:ureidoglycolate lyase